MWTWAGASNTASQGTMSNDASTFFKITYLASTDLVGCPIRYKVYSSCSTVTPPSTGFLNDGVAVMNIDGVTVDYIKIVPQDITLSKTYTFCVKVIDDGA